MSDMFIMKLISKIKSITTFETRCRWRRKKMNSCYYNKKNAIDKMIKLH